MNRDLDKLAFLLEQIKTSLGQDQNDLALIDLDLALRHTQDFYLNLQHLRQNLLNPPPPAPSEIPPSTQLEETKPNRPNPQPLFLIKNEETSPQTPPSPEPQPNLISNPFEETRNAEPNPLNPISIEIETDINTKQEPSPEENNPPQRMMFQLDSEPSLPSPQIKKPALIQQGPKADDKPAPQVYQGPILHEENFIDREPESNQEEPAAEIQPPIPNPESIIPNIDTQTIEPETQIQTPEIQSQAEPSRNLLSQQRYELSGGGREEKIDKPRMNFREEFAEFFIQKPIIDLHEKLANGPVDKFIKAMSFNLQMLFANELFKGDTAQFRKVVEILDQAGDFDQARKYLEEHCFEAYDWLAGKRRAVVLDFIKALRRRHTQQS